jgi:hypothetical protein
MPTLLNTICVPLPPNVNTTPVAFDSTFSISDSLQELAIIFDIPRSGTIDAVEFLTGNGSTGTVGISIREVDVNTGAPSSTDTPSTSINLSANQWTRVVIPETTVAKGEIKAACWKFASGQSGLLILNCISTTGTQTFTNFPYTARKTGASWVKSSARIPVMSLRYSDKTYEYIHGIWPINSLQNTSFNQNSTINERGLLFRVPVPLTLSGCWFFGTFTGAGSLDVILYDSKDNILTSVSLDTDASDTSAQIHNVALPTSQALFPNIYYRLVLKPTSGVNINLQQFSVNTDSNGTHAIMSAVPGGQTWCLTTRTNPTDWTENRTSRPWMGLFFDGIIGEGAVVEIESLLIAESAANINLSVNIPVVSSFSVLSSVIVSGFLDRNITSNMNSIISVNSESRGGVTSVPNFVLPLPTATNHASTIPLLSSGANSGILDSSGKRIAHIFQAPRTGIIDTVEFYCGPTTLTGTLRVSFQDVSAINGNPDGIQDQYVNITTLTANSWNTIGLIRNRGEKWIFRTPAGASQNWRDVIWSPELGLFVAVTAQSSNRVMTSPDGIVWTARLAAEDNSWLAITWSSQLNLFVAVAQTGTNRVMTSPNGITWTARSHAGDLAWTDVVWSPELELFVAVSAFPGAAMTSPDGETWTLRENLAGSYASVTWSPELELFVAVGDTISGNAVAISSDGINWTTYPAANTNTWVSVTWSPQLGLFAAVASAGSSTARIMTSSNGTTWSAREAIGHNGTGGSWRGLTWAEEMGTFVAMGQGTDKVMTSIDGITWIVGTELTQTAGLAVVWSPEWQRFVAVGGSGGTPIVATCDGKRYVTRGDILSIVWEYQSFNSGNQVTIGFYEGSPASLINFPYRAHFNGSSWAKLPNPTEIALVYNDGSYAVPDGSFSRSGVDSVSFNVNSTPNERGMLFQFPIKMRISGCWLLITLTADANVILYDSENNVLANVSLDPDMQFLNTGDYHKVTFPTSQIIQANQTYRIAIKPVTSSSITLHESVYASTTLRRASSPNSMDWYSTSRLNNGAWTDTVIKKPWVGFFIDGIEEN